MAKRSMRNLQSAGRSALKVSGRTTEKAAVGLARWATTDHAGIGSSLEYLPILGFRNTLKIITMRFLFAILGAVLTVIWIMFLISCLLFVI
jgi:hypothetical protein